VRAALARSGTSTRRFLLRAERRCAPHRPREGRQRGAEGTSSMAHALVRLHAYRGDDDLPARAEGDDPFPRGPGDESLLAFGHLLGAIDRFCRPDRGRDRPTLATTPSRCSPPRAAPTSRTSRCASLPERRSSRPARAWDARRKTTARPPRLPRSRAARHHDAGRARRCPPAERSPAPCCASRRSGAPEPVPGRCAGVVIIERSAARLMSLGQRSMHDYNSRARHGHCYRARKQGALSAPC
jgi:hypothetical protein